MNSRYRVRCTLSSLLVSRAPKCYLIEKYLNLTFFHVLGFDILINQPFRSYNSHRNIATVVAILK